MKNLNEIVDQVKDAEKNMNNILVPLFKDSIADANKYGKRSFVLNIILAISVLIIAIFSQVLVAIQNQKYADFLSQFEFESEQTTYTQDLDSTDGGNAIINSGITVTN